MGWRFLSVDPATVDLATGAVAAAQALAPEIRARARAREGERLRTMPADLADRIEAAGLFALWLPRSLSGFELDPATIVRIIEEMACPSRRSCCSSTREDGIVVTLNTRQPDGALVASEHELSVRERPI